jgi:hypothetical protein
MLLALAPTAVFGASIVVDGKHCTLADAIVAANTNAAAGGCRAGDDKDNGGDIIELKADVVLTDVNNFDSSNCGNGLPPVTSTITIAGNSHEVTRAGGPWGPSPLFRLFDSSAGNLILQNVAVTNGHVYSSAANCNGGGINGTVTVIGSTVSDNVAEVGAGGGISGDATLVDSTVSGNFVFNGSGGGIDGTANLVNSTVTRNSISVGHGAGINGVSRLLDSVVSGNCHGCGPAGPKLAVRRAAAAKVAQVPDDVPAGGGGITGSVTLIHSIVSGNSAGGAFAEAGGGLIVVGTASIVDSTISGNSAGSGQSIGAGIWLASGSATLVNSTVSGNTAVSDRSGSNLGCSGVGIFSASLGIPAVPGGALTLIQSTVSNNTANPDHCPPQNPPYFGGTAAGVFGGDVTLVNSIVAGNSAGNSADRDCFAGNIRFQGLSLVGDGSCGAASSGQLTGDPMLSPLGDYGRFTPVQIPLPGSPVIDRIAFIAGTGCEGTDVKTDERGVARPQGGKCDIGAVQFTGFPNNTVLDNFTQADATLSANWSGQTDSASYTASDDEVAVGNGGPIYWNAASFAADQEAYVTLAHIAGGEHGLLLKVQADSGGRLSAAIEVLYDAKSQSVRVETSLPKSAGTTYADIPALFADGDQLGARVYANGGVRIYRNDVQVGTVNLNANDQAAFGQGGGQIGLSFHAAGKAVFDDFGGGNVVSSQ